MEIIKKNKLFILILFLIIVFAYANTLKGTFLTADDIEGYILDLSIRNTLKELLSFDLYKIYYAVCYKLFGINPLPLHATNIFLHFLTSIAGFLCITKLFNKKIAKYAVVLFAVHPVNSEAVSWISAHGYLFQALFFFSILYFFITYRETNIRKYIYYALALFILEIILIRSPWIIGVIPMIIAVDIFLLGNKPNKQFIFLVLIFCLPVLGYIFLKSEEIFTRYAIYSDNYRMLSIALPRYSYTIFSILKLHLFPLKLSLYHEGELVTNEQYRMMFLVLVVFVISMAILFKKNKQVFGLFLLILIGTLPSLTPFKVTWYVAERYYYLASIFFCTFLVLLFFGIEKEFEIKNVSIILICAFFVFYFTRTVIRTNDWLSSKNLWISTQKTNPLSFRVYNNLGNVYIEEKNYDLAIENFKIAIEKYPAYRDAIHNMGNAYYFNGDYDEAKKLYERALEIDPNLFVSYFQLGNIELREGNIDNAKELFKKTLELNPAYYPASDALKEL